VPFGYFEVPGDRGKAEELKQRRLSHDIFRHLSLRLMKLAEFEEFNRQIKLKTLIAKRESILKKVSTYKLIPGDTQISQEFILEMRQEASDEIKEINMEIESLE
jgi:hypothetical protein